MPQKTPKNTVDMVEKAEEKMTFKNQNPNHTHNTKKESLGPNTKR